MFVSTGEVGRVGGVLLILAYALLVGVIWRVEREPPAIGEVSEAYEELDEPGSAGVSATAVALVLAGVALMIVGGTIAVVGAERVVDSLGIADSAVGLTFVRVGYDRGTVCAGVGCAASRDYGAGRRRCIRIRRL